MAGELIDIIRSADPAIRHAPLSRFCEQATLSELIAACVELDEFRHTSTNLYERVRALLFLSTIYRYYIPPKLPPTAVGSTAYEGYLHLLERRFEEAVRVFRPDATNPESCSEAAAIAMSQACRGLAFQTLADQVRHSVRSVAGNRWMFRVGHPLDHPLSIRPELLQSECGAFPVLCESTPVRMDLSHSAWSDIFFLGMDYPEGARVLNISVDLAVRGSANDSPRPPVQTFLRVIDEPVLRLVSVDLKADADITTLGEVFDFGRDYLGLLKAAVIASGLVPSALESSHQPLAPLLARLTGRPGHGVEIVTVVHNIPKGSRLAVSTNLLASIIAACMRATRQIPALTGQMTEADRRHVAARAILGEWLGGSGGGWQDSGGVWPGIKLIEGVHAKDGDPEFGISRGCLLPKHHVLGNEEVAPGLRDTLQNSLILVHGGMAQDVGPILEMVTERYLLRSEAEWKARGQAQSILSEVLGHMRSGDMRQIAGLTNRNYFGPIQTIIPWAGNHYTDQIAARCREQFGDRFWGFWMLGGMAGGGMGFVFDPAVKAEAQEWLGATMLSVKRELQAAVPFAMDPVVYNFAVNENGTTARVLPPRDAGLPPSYYEFRMPQLIRREPKQLSEGQRTELESVGMASRTRPELAGLAAALLEHLLPRTSIAQPAGEQSLDALLAEFGFDPVQHEAIRGDLRSGRVGLAQNTLPPTARIEDVPLSDLIDTRVPSSESTVRTGTDALRSGRLAVLTLAGGAGSRWTGGAGIVKALMPFAKFAGHWRTFLEMQLSKTRRASRQWDAAIPHVFTTSYLTDGPMRRHLDEYDRYGFDGPLYVSQGRSVGLRMIPMTRDLRFLWEQTPQQILDVQKQKVRESVRSALLDWARSMGEGSDYRDNLPQQCLHPVGHWYELPNMLLNGTMHRLLTEHPSVQHLLLHNLDTLGAYADPQAFGAHVESGAAMTVELIPRTIEDHGGGLARVDGRARLVEGLALPDEKLEFELSWYNSGTMWIDVDQILAAFGLRRADLGDAERVSQAVRHTAARMPTYITIKDVKRRWGRGQEDIFPVSQFEKIWGDMTALPGLECRYMLVPRRRGQQLKQVSQLDAWLRDGSAAWVESLLDWN